MPASDNHNSAKLTLIKGNRLTPQEFSRLSFPDKLDHLHRLDGKAQLDLLLTDADGQRLTQALPPLEIYQLAADVGQESAADLLSLVSPRQELFILDQELWDNGEFLPDRAFAWLGTILAAGEDHFLQILPHLELELLILTLKQGVIVRGGMGDLISDEERDIEWDHSFDDCYFLKFINQEYAQLIGMFLDIVFRIDQHLYLALMEGIKGELVIEQAELCLQFRAGRLADEGIPSLEESLTVYTRVSPDSFRLAGDKVLAPIRNDTGLATTHQPATDTLVARLLARLASPELTRELQYLINKALVADRVQLTNGDAVQRTGERVAGLLSIALEHLSGGDEEQALAIIRKEFLLRLFHLGYSIVMGLHDRAGAVTSDDYPTKKALSGVMEKRPRFYRGLDPDGVDDYREFSALANVRRVEWLLTQVAGSEQA
ncbi:DUF6178 family protein [Geobacter argillaceus]|uniref:Uncharacterized protein n=1 Tax=Geobacter argillaceus TaxID=345631 RepID=A0A562VMW6_9BACT|nr:DUF6178 family protein [Geobacter argillaceus]TWJ19250.1 hypothetical protein JN12_01941 [Geobacter argillaceus]